MNKEINIAQYIDHTLLKSDSSVDDIRELCKEAIAHNFYAVCVNSAYTNLAHDILAAHSTKLAVTVGFPVGAMHTEAKAAEAYRAVLDGADEIDMVLNIGFLKSSMHAEVEADMRAVVEASQRASLQYSRNNSKENSSPNALAEPKHIVVKVIFENCLLSDEEKRIACKLSINAGVDYIKTSTGFTTGSLAASGATKADLALMLEEIKGTALKVKAAGGVKDTLTALEFISMGISRIGTSSGIALIQGTNNTKGY